MRARRRTTGPDLLTWEDRKRSRRGYVELIGAPSEQEWHIRLVSEIRELRLLSEGWAMTHFPAGGERTAKSGAIMKAMGLERGWPDLLFCRPPTRDLLVGLPHGLELKRLGETTTDDQDRIAERFRAFGWPYAVADNIGAAVDVLTGWGAIRVVLS